jgi:two-component system chemotaxis response regulator CheB
MMTGMGSDGLQGCRLIREAGGRVMAQDETTSVVWGMPGAVVHDGQADLLAPLHKLANEITGWTSHAERTIRA